MDHIMIPWIANLNGVDIRGISMDILTSWRMSTKYIPGISMDIHRISFDVYPWYIRGISMDIPRFLNPDFSASQCCWSLSMRTQVWVILSVLKSHFNRPHSFVLEQLLSKSEKRFVRTHCLQEVLGLSEVLWVRTVLFVGKCEFRFWRFKKASRALATRAKARLLDLNWQSSNCTA